VIMIMAATRAEFTKIISLRSSWIATGIVVALHLLVQATNLRSNLDAVAAITPNGCTASELVAAVADLRFGWMVEVGEDRALCLFVSCI
jgi:hypothetical protein